MAEHVDVLPSEVHEILGRHVLTDGMKLVLDLKRSHGSRLVDARNGTRYLDLYTFFASAPLGINPPGIVDDPTFMAELAEIAANKPANPDMYTTAYAEFVETFVRVLGDPALPHLFFIEGGALAVENALKVAFDWKSRQNEAAGRDPELGTKIMHLTQAFHGRSGYTLSLTNTEPNKTDRFPKFDWPRIDVPAITFPLDDHLDEVVAAEQRALDAGAARVRRAPDDIAASSPSRSRARAATTTSAPSSSRPAGARAMITTRCSSSTRCRPGSAPPARPGPTSSWACNPTSSPSPRRPRSAASWPAAGSTRCRTTCSRCPGGSTPPGAAISSTWSGPGRILEIIESDGLIEAAAAEGAATGLAGLRGDQHRDRQDQQCPRPRPVRRLSTCRRPAERDGVVTDLARTRARHRAALRRTRSVRFRPALSVSEDEI